MINETSWEKLIERVKEVSFSVFSLLVSSKFLESDGEKIKIGVCYKFHKEMLDDFKNKQILENIAFDVFNKPLRFECLLIEEPSKQEKPNTVLTEIDDNNILKSAEELFF